MLNRNEEAKKMEERGIGQVRMERMENNTDRWDQSHAQGKCREKSTKMQTQRHTGCKKWREIGVSFQAMVSPSSGFLGMCHQIVLNVSIFWTTDLLGFTYI